MSKNIRIENPMAGPGRTPSGPGYTSWNRACRYVNRGQAVWSNFGVAIRFVSAESNHRVQSAQRSVDRTIRGYDLAAYGSMAQMHELTNVPVIAPAILLKLGRRKGASRHTFLAAQGL